LATQKVVQWKTQVPVDHFNASAVARFSRAMQLTAWRTIK